MRVAIITVLITQGAHLACPITAVTAAVGFSLARVIKIAERAGQS